MGRAFLFSLTSLIVGCGDDGRANDADAGVAPDAARTIDAASTVDAGPYDPATVTWSMVEPPGDGPLRVWGFLVADLGDGRAVVFGGTTASAVGGVTLDGTWLYDMRGETPVVRAIEASGPAGRYCGCAAYDPERDVVVMTGGRDVVLPLSIPPETWELSLATESWTQIDVPETPGGVVGCSLAYAREPAAMHLFGGGGEMGYSDVTYRYDPAAPAWVPLDATGPTARYDAIFVPMHDGHRLLLFAGSFGAMGAAFYSDVWIFDAREESWSELAIEGEPPPGRRTPWTAWAPGGRGLYVANGYDGAMQPIGDFHYLDLEERRWVALPSEGAPSARGFSQGLPGPDGTLGAMLGGYDGDAPVPELWLLRAAP